ncbi:TetR family transcriptional regulator [Crossiella sp. CA-258035]|uniref:TetR/AcrR family transcriptional regulator n=1 Tax=Crossiella sp. CA-258035 TaxID=2981138 RepID=UPI0024BC173A|nr:TetR family transcriptional regulator [Crossiella sp. CA-258035]WHT22478.1 TetR family transcriptional regulator [Crossiella sp. CA-258035]
MDDLGLRERKKRQTRLALSQAAIRLTVARGWESVTIEDIAAEADVSVRTFRNYFGGKAEAVAASQLDRGLRIAAELRERPAAEPLWTALTEVVRAQYATPPVAGPEPERDERWLSGLRAVLAVPAVQAEVQRANLLAQEELAAAIAERAGLGAEEVYPRLVAAVVGAGSSVAVAQWLRADPLGSVVPVLDEVFDHIRAGLPVPAKGDA